MKTYLSHDVCDWQIFFHSSSHGSRRHCHLSQTTHEVKFPRTTSSTLSSGAPGRNTSLMTAIALVIMQGQLPAKTSFAKRGRGHEGTTTAAMNKLCVQRLPSSAATAYKRQLGTTTSGQVPGGFTGDVAVVLRCCCRLEPQHAQLVLP